MRQLSSKGFGMTVTDKEIVACEGCGSRSLDLLHRSRRTGLPIARCADCRLVAVIGAAADDRLFELYSSGPTYENYVDSQQTESLKRRRAIAIERIRALLPAGVGSPALFDVGAGRGDFLAMARDEGFAVAGNEISQPAIDLCAERHRIALLAGDLAELRLAERFDALTMWCVLAHAADPRQLLRGTFGLLKPGGVLYFHTPRWCAIDSVGLAATKLTGGRLPQITERRVNTAHLRLYDVANLTRLLTSVGYEVVDATPTVGYSLLTQTYLADLGIPDMLRRGTARLFDRLIERGWFARNILDVYARRPATDD